jgi:hypothetical protein
VLLRDGAADKLVWQDVRPSFELRGLIVALQYSAFILAIVLFKPVVRANPACSRAELQHQSRDVATVQRLERAWSIAYLRGDEELEKCLLLPGFMEVMKDGRIKYLRDELDFARTNRGRNLQIPSLPISAVLLHGNVAAAYGVSESTTRDGAYRSVRYVDHYVWEDGMWHAYFAQQTPVLASTPVVEGQNRAQVLRRARVR